MDNTNDFSYVDGKVVDYLCDEGVIFNNHRYSYYASTWEGTKGIDKGFNGKCMIKIQTR